MVCRDHPLVNSRRGVEINKKNGIHVHFPDLVMDRRKLMEIRSESLDMADCFGCENDKEDIFDKGVYLRNGLILYGGRKPGRTQYYISRCYVISTSYDHGSIRFDLERADLLSIPSNGDILRRTILRVDEYDLRIAPNLIPISLPLQQVKQTCKPNHNVKYGSFALWGNDIIESVFQSLPVSLNRKTST